MLKEVLTIIVGRYFRYQLRNKERTRVKFSAPWWLELYPAARRVRQRYWDVVFDGLAEGVEIAESTKIIAPGLISIGSGSRITRDVVLDGRGGLTIGKNTLIGFDSVIITHSHRYHGSEPIIYQGMESAPVQIGDDVWLSARVIVVPGVTIGDHAIIGAGAVVSADIPCGAIAVGVPAKVKSYRPGFVPEDY